MWKSGWHSVTSHYSVNFCVSWKCTLKNKRCSTVLRRWGGMFVEEGRRRRAEGDKIDDGRSTHWGSTMWGLHESHPTVMSPESNGGTNRQKIPEHMTKRQWRLLPPLGFTSCSGAWLFYSHNALRNLLHVDPEALISPQQSSPVLFSLTPQKNHWRTSLCLTVA